jgi:hypothetical protein
MYRIRKEKKKRRGKETTLKVYHDHACFFPHFFSGKNPSLKQ